MRKCLAAGYDEVILIATAAKVVRTLAAAIAETLSPESRAKLHVFSTEDFIAHLDAMAVPEQQEQRVRGYKVTVRHRPVGAAEAKARSEAIARVLVQGRRRLSKAPRSDDAVMAIG